MQKNRWRIMVTKAGQYDTFVEGLENYDSVDAASLVAAMLTYTSSQGYLYLAAPFDHKLKGQTNVTE